MSKTHYAIPSKVRTIPVPQFGIARNSEQHLSYWSKRLFTQDTVGLARAFHTGSPAKPAQRWPSAPFVTPAQLQVATRRVRNPANGPTAHIPSNVINRACPESAEESTPCPCQPYSSEELDSLPTHAGISFVRTAVMGLANVAGAGATELYNRYLYSGSPTSEQYGTDSALAQAFGKASETGDFMECVANLVTQSLSGGGMGRIAGRTQVPVTEFVAQSILDQHASKLKFTGYHTTPGLVAGGTGESDIYGSDSRSVTGDVYFEYMTVKTGNSEEKKIKSASLDLTFSVTDTVDFCPGDCGGWIAQSLTLTLSRLEASNMAWDANFAVTYKAPQRYPVTLP